MKKTFQQIVPDILKQYNIDLLIFDNMETESAPSGEWYEYNYQYSIQEAIVESWENILSLATEANKKNRKVRTFKKKINKLYQTELLTLSRMEIESAPSGEYSDYNYQYMIQESIIETYKESLSFLYTSG